MSKRIRAVAVLAPIVAAIAVGMAACGGRSSATSATAVSAGGTFPTGLSVGTPSELNTTGTVASIQPFDGVRFAYDAARAAGAAFRHGDGATLGRVATALLPMGTARAAATMEPALKGHSVLIDKIASADSGVTLGTGLDMNALFGSANNANCYGPSIAYSSHEDAGGGASAGTLPSGDLGLWTATQGGTQPCIAAQLNARVAGVKGRVKQGLLLAAVMRRTVGLSSTLSMPTAGTSVNLQTAMQTVAAALPELTGVTVDAATIALNGGGTIYTYRLALSKGTGASALSGEVILTHTPGGSHTAYSGVMQVAGFFLSNDAAFSCSDQVDGATSRFKVAQVSTLKYGRNGSDIAFGSRDGMYCGHPVGGTSNNAAEVASFTVDGQLDPTVKLAGNVRGVSTGWRAGFTRFAGEFDRDTVAGDFLFAWQAGTNDGNSRALAAHADYNTTTETRSLDGYFAFAGDIATTDGSLLGMICNWAGPGNSHTTGLRFQSQAATLGPSASEYALGTSKITYAPTNSCSSTTTSFDVDANGTLAGAEGLGTTANLDTPTGANTVQQEIAVRGFVKPSLF